MPKYLFNLSIITVSQNYSDDLFKCLESTKNLENISEHIIVIPEISLSQKKSLFEIRKNIKFTTDKKKGVYNAINIGIIKSSGKYILLLHGDNILTLDGSKLIHNQILKDVSSTQFGCFFQQKNNIRKIFYNYRISKLNLLMGLYPPHPGLLMKREDIIQLGLYNENYKICSDFDYYLRILSNKIIISYLDKSIIISYQGGISTNGFISIFNIISERIKILNYHYSYNKIVITILILLGYLIKITNNIFYKD